MKRCSQCDFIYEDDQHLCDMDGHELVYEPTLHGFQSETATKPVTRSASSGARRQALAAGVALLIAIVLSVGYSGFTREYAPQNTKAPSTNVVSAPQPEPDQTDSTPADQTDPTPADQTDPAPADQTDPTPAVSPTTSPSESEKTTVSPTSTSPIALSTPRSTDSSREKMRSQPARANHKKQSRIGGFLKKTGNLLKKPFKKL
jgi:type IV secretory pathway VirB10-like protein